jgi:uncharacterized membrane protein YraQ (UPF0718 family)
MIALFAIVYHLPIEQPRFSNAILEAARLAKWYAREHVLLCLIPAFFIAGAVSALISKNAIVKYFGASAKKWISYSVASISGTILAVCSCTVLPLFAGIYAKGAGLGPAVAFLYSGPAINVLAIVLTANVLGWKLGAARAIGSIVFSILIGLIMHRVFRGEERTAQTEPKEVHWDESNKQQRPLWQIGLYFASMIAILVFANWAPPIQQEGIWFSIYQRKWFVTGLFALIFAFSLWRFFHVTWWWLLLAALPPALMRLLFPATPVVAFTAGAIGIAVILSLGSQELRNWRDQTWRFTKQTLPLLFMGVLAAGFFLGSPESTNAGIIPNIWIQSLVGDSPEPMMALLLGQSAHAPTWLSAIWPLWTNFFASITGAFMYFATLTEVPILLGLINSGMGQGPALSLLLAGPALSLPNMLVINAILGPRKTATFVGLVVIMATITGFLFGIII